MRCFAYPVNTPLALLVNMQNGTLATQARSMSLMEFARHCLVAVCSLTKLADKIKSDIDIDSGQPSQLLSIISW